MRLSLTPYCLKQASVAGITAALLLGLVTPNLFAQDEQTMARVWNEALLHAIRNDLARPTVHARNLHHWSMACYDAWAASTAPLRRTSSMSMSPQSPIQLLDARPKKRR